jgi:hypothetical protein
MNSGVIVNKFYKLGEDVLVSYRNEFVRGVIVRIDFNKLFYYVRLESGLKMWYSHCEIRLYCRN